MNGRAYYNEFDEKKAEWLRHLIKAGAIAPGHVDTRSIRAVQPGDLDGFTQCHFFAGIGVWSYALRNAGWPDDRPVWTGSCPCQPFSVAGKRKAHSDDRHLWPELFRLIRERRPERFLGEQVASKDGLAWLDTVLSDLEGAAYTAGAVDLCAAGVGAPHIRQRLWIVANAMHTERRAVNGHRQDGGDTPRVELERFRDVGRMGHPGSSRRQPQPPIIRIDGEGVGSPRGEQVPGIEAGSHVFDEQPATSPTNGHWRNADWLLCRDGKWRPVEPGTFPLAHGAPARVGRLRGYGDAIAAPLAEEFIKVVMENFA